MNTTMTERFNVAGALLVKLFGRHDDEADDFSDRAGRVRDIGVRSAHVRPGVLHRPGLVGADRRPRPSTGSAGTSSSPAAITLGTLVALATYVTRIYTPLTASRTRASTS